MTMDILMDTNNGMFMEQKTNKFCMAGRLYYSPMQNPRPYSSITEVDPLEPKFTKSVFWCLHRGFREQAWENSSTSLEPELDWTFQLLVEEKNIRLFH